MLGARPGHFPGTFLVVIDLALCADCGFSDDAVYKDQTRDNQSLRTVSIRAAAWTSSFLGLLHLQDGEMENMEPERP